MRAIYWLRNDLRLADNPALTAAATETDCLIPIYIFDESTPRPLGSAQRWWLHHSLKQLQQQFLDRESSLLLRKGVANQILLQLVKQHKIDTVYWNNCYEPQWIKHDARLKSELQRLGVTVKTYQANLLMDPSHLKTQAGGIFKVFTPFWRALNSKLQPRKLYPTPRQLPKHEKLVSDELDTWNLLPKNPDWSTGFVNWHPGETNAHLVLENFINDAISDYSQQRDFPSISATSHLSPYLHFGEISPWQIWSFINESNLSHLAEPYLRQLGWREFAYYFLFHHPDFYCSNFKKEFDHFPWKKNSKFLTAWQRGLTGYPIVDAGMRELWHTGIMHNRVRMITASFLTKDLLIDWRQGEAWFWDTLLDADLANNAMGWQWVAGTGVDAAPYFRIFNPILQGEKFDPDGDYVRKWLPELAKLPKKYIHQPFKAPEKILADAGIILGADYPKPIVDHAAVRANALNVYKNLK